MLLGAKRYVWPIRPHEAPPLSSQLHSSAGPEVRLACRSHQVCFIAGESRRDDAPLAVNGVPDPVPGARLELASLLSVARFLPLGHM